MNRRAPASTITVQCPIFGGVEVGRAQCQEQCAVIGKNLGTCEARSCGSPWRLCTHCLLQGYKADDAVVVDAIWGKCAFHEEHGPDADRRVPSSLKMGGGKASAATAHQEGAVIVVSTDRIRPFKGQPRGFFDPEELKALEGSIIRRGQLQPGIVRKLTNERHDYELIDGQRRWHACRTLKLPFRAIVTAPKDVEDQFEMSIVANFQRAEHTPVEIASAIDRLCKLGGRSELDVAALFGRSGFWVNTYRRLCRLVPELQRVIERPKRESSEGTRLQRGELPLTLAFELALLPAKDQLQAYQDFREKGTSIAEARQSVRVSLGGPVTRETRTLSPEKQFQRLKSYASSTRYRAEDLGRRLDDSMAGKMTSVVDRKKLDAMCDDIDVTVRNLSEIRKRIARSYGRD